MSNALAGLNIDTPNTTEGSGEDPEKCSKEERDEAELKVAEAMKENSETHESSAITHRADKKDTDSEEESEDEEEINEDEPRDPEPAGEGLERGKTTYTKIIKTSHDLRVLHAKWPKSDIYLARGEILIEAGNYPLAVKEGKAAIVRKRTGPEDSRSLAEAQHQLGVAQAYISKVIESDVSRCNAIAVLGERKKDLESGGEKARVKVRKRPSIIIGIQLN